MVNHQGAAKASPVFTEWCLNQSETAVVMAMIMPMGECKNDTYKGEELKEKKGFGIIAASSRDHDRSNGFTRCKKRLYTV